MKTKQYDEMAGYRRLAEAVVRQAVHDYKWALKRLQKHPREEKARYRKADCERFFEKEIGTYSDLDGSWIVKMVRNHALKAGGDELNKDIFDRYKPNKKRREILENQLATLYGRLEEVPVVQGKVTGSSPDYPYIECHVTVPMEDPDAAAPIRKRIQAKETEKAKIEKEMLEVESHIACMQEGIEKDIFEMVYLDEMTQEDVADTIGYTQARVSQIIKNVIEGDRKKDL